LELGLFALLAEGPLSRPTSANAWRCIRGWSRTGWPALVGLGLLTHGCAGYRNGAPADWFLVPGRPSTSAASVVSNGRVHYQLGNG